MTEERTVIVESKPYCVVISDEAETLLAARAAGRVPVGLWRNTEDFSMVKYLVETLDDVDDRFLERVVRRELRLPWNIAESDRLILREFVVEDWQKIPMEPQDEDADRVFYDKEKLEAYIRNQYGFYEYGVWAVVRKEDGVIVGKAGVVGTGEVSAAEGTGTADTLFMMELGYHMFLPYRRQGYAVEACRLILNYIHEEFEAQVFAVTKKSNAASRGVLENLGFVKCAAGEYIYRKIKEKDSDFLCFPGKIPAIWVYTEKYLCMTVGFKGKSGHASEFSCVDLFECPKGGKLLMPKKEPSQATAH